MNAKIHTLLKTGLLSNLFEWYEFSIFGYLAGYLGRLFFDSAHSSSPLLQVFALFAISHLIRPFGGLIFGPLGDKKGRSYALKLSLFLMSAPTILIGILPTYPVVGSWATGCLLILRLIQAFGAGGERPLLGCYVFENAPLKHQGLLTSAVIVSGLVGILLGSLVSTLLAWTFNEGTLLSWAWRIPFLLGIPMTYYIFYIRQFIHEGPLDPSPYSPRQKDKSTIISFLTTCKGQLLQSCLLTALAMTCFYTLIIWMPSYLQFFLNIPSKIAFLINTLMLCVMVPLYLSAGWLSDKLGYKRLIVGAILIILLAIYPLFLSLQMKAFGALLVINLMFGLCLSGIDPLMIQCLGHLFPKEMRSSGMGIGHTLGASLFGGTAPWICTWLIHQTGLSTAPAFYIMFFGLLALPVALRLKAPRVVPQPDTQSSFFMKGS